MIRSLPHIIDAAAERSPDREAFRFEASGLTYEALSEKAGQLASVLAEQGVRRGDRVGILLNKSLETPVAVYGIMKAGACYVPLDPGAPASRLESVIRDCGIRHLVSHEPKRRAVQAIVPACPNVTHVIGLDHLPAGSATVTPWEAVESTPVHNGRSPARRSEDGLAYIMYTSGSTGVPKGIMHTHRSGLSYARAAARLYGVRADDRLSNHSPIHFDMSTFDYFSGPLAGATTIIIPEAYTKLPASLSNLIEDERMTIWYSVPFALIQLLLRGLLDKRDLSSLRWVLFGGEPFPPKHLLDLMRRLPQARFSNVYGPAEVNQCTYYHVPESLAGRDASADDPVPLGSIWSNAEGIVLDENGHHAGVGECGELLIRTPTMMQGYWGRPDLDQSAFYYAGEGHAPADRYYRTGDLVEVLPSNQLHFVGRKDRQIKSRGFRVELDEVERALLSHEAVEEAAAFACADGEGSLRIEAAVVLGHETSIDEKNLQRHAAAHLPAYAVPRRIAVNVAFPRTTTGKIDRGALQAAAADDRTG